LHCESFVDLHFWLFVCCLLHCESFVDLRPLVLCLLFIALWVLRWLTASILCLLSIALWVLRWLTASGCLSVVNCIVSPSLTYGFWSLLWYIHNFLSESPFHWEEKSRNFLIFVKCVLLVHDVQYNDVLLVTPIYFGWFLSFFLHLEFVKFLSFMCCSIISMMSITTFV
jgi:hypothetical protein